MRGAVGLTLLLAAVPARGALDELLQRRLEEAARGFQGAAGIYVRHLPSGREAGLRADELFPSASLVKVPILLTVFDRLERGELPYSEPLVYSSSRAYAGADLLGSFKDGETITLSRLVLLSASLSDNTASLWLQELAGGGAGINAWLAGKGFERTRVNSRAAGREKDKERFGWGQTTPREIAQLLVALRAGALLGAGGSEELYRMLSRAFWDSQALSQLPPTVLAASKQGAVERSRSELLLVEAPSGPYVLAVLTREQKDASWGPDNEGYRLLRAVSRIVWESFEPGSPYRPPEGRMRYFKQDS